MFFRALKDSALVDQRIRSEIGYEAPDVARYIIEFGYGDNYYSRPGLTKQQRALVTISSLVTQGTEPQIKPHINTWLTAGLTTFRWAVYSSFSG